MPGEIAEKILKGAREAAAYAQGKPVLGMRQYEVIIPEPDEVNVKEIRAKLGMTQQLFSKTFGFSLSGLRKMGGA